jgi:hypothetical protein
MEIVTAEKMEVKVMTNCAWCENKSTQFRMLQKVCDSCANEYDEHDQKYGH